MILTLAVNPEPWTPPDIQVARGKGGRGVRGYASPSSTLKAYQAAVKEALEAALNGRDMPFQSGDELMVHFYFWRNVAVYQSATTGRKQHRNIADASNMTKSTEDACQGILFDNDRNNRMVTGEIVAQGESVSGKVGIQIERYEPSQDDTTLEFLFPDPIEEKPDNTW